MTVYSFDGAFRNLNNAITGIGDGFDERRKREASQAAINAAASGDYTGAAKAFSALGDVGSSLKLMEIGQTRADRQTGDANFQSLVGGGSGLGSIGVSTQASTGGGQTLANLGTANQIETRFMGAAKEAGLNNPVGLAALGATGLRESGWSPSKANATWSDPSQSGQPGTSGGILSWRGPRLQAMYKFAQSRGEQQGNVSPETQALFAFQEDPTLVHRLNASKTPEEANRVMAQAWRYAGYDGSGPEYQARLNATRQYMARYNGQGGQPTQVAQGGQENLPADGAQTAQGFTVPGQGRTGGGPTPQAAQGEINRLSRGLASGSNMRPEQVRFIERRIEELQKFTDPARALTMEGQELDNAEKRRKADGNQMSRQAQERARVALEYGLKKDTPEYRRFVITAQMPADSAPVTRQIKQADGSEVAVQWDAQGQRWIPLTAPEGGNAVRPNGMKLTEGQSKDLVYYNRGTQALQEFEPIGEAYASGVQRTVSGLPFGNYAVSENFQKAEQSGRNLLASILRKDTGAAITVPEEKQYGDIFLPRPGDKPGTLALKKKARTQALEAIKTGLGPAQILAVGSETLGAGQGKQGAPSKINSPQEYQSLPSGATFTAPDGSLRRKP